MKFQIIGVVLCVLALNLNNVQGKILQRKLGLRNLKVPANINTFAENYGTFESRLDHFDITNNATFQMRYIENDVFFVPGSPLFLFLGGEWAIEHSYVVTGQMYDMAQQHSGYMLYLEHRYYGSSVPTANLSTDNLKWLSADQALEDVALFITTKKATIPGLENSKVVVVGGSYSASLTTWARLKYPHLVTVGYASSAPLHAVADFQEYFEVVSENIGLVNAVCWNTIAEGISIMEQDLTTAQGIYGLSVLIGSCNLIRIDEPYRSYFFNSIAEIFAQVIQNAQPGDINNACNTLLSFDGNSRDKLAQYIKYKHDGSCMGDYDEFVQQYQSPVITADIYRQWMYQSCTEFGYFQTSTSNYQPFGQTFSLDLFVRWCKDLFGEKFSQQLLNDGIARTNIVYGSTQPALTHVVTVQGSVDPWHTLGLVQNLSALAPAFYVHGTSHCADLSSASASDLPEMAAAKQGVKDLVAEWLS